MSCPDDNALVDLLDGRLAAKERAEIEAHVDTCPSCRRLIAALSRKGGPAEQVRPGTVVDGKYRVDSVLGAGGMGVVLAATHLQLESRVALKFMRSELADDPTASARFLREARVATRLRSEHVARVLDARLSGEGPSYIVFELLEGEDLGTRLARGPLPVREAVDLTLQALDALAEAHSAGLVHRDLKPSNLFVTRRADGTPCLKVLDFGLVRGAPTGSGPQVETSGAALVGSPLYMAPEQLTSSHVDLRADIFSLGCVLYELLCGRRAFDAATLPEVVARVMHSPVPPLLPLAPSVPEPLARAVERCLAKAPEARFGSVGELAAALAPFGSPRAPKAARRSRALWAAAGAGVVAVGLALAVSSLGRAPRNPEGPPSPPEPPPVVETTGPDAAPVQIVEPPQALDAAVKEAAPRPKVVPRVRRAEAGADAGVDDPVFGTRE